MSNVLGCTLFGGIVGSPVADVSAMGSVMIPLMKKEGYDADYAVNVTTHAALVGALMPTSHNLIIFTLATSGIASVSVLGLILAGLVPALILTLCNLARRLLRGRSSAATRRAAPSRAGARSRVAFAAALPGLLVVVIILVGILSGAFTATESASIAVAWALLVTVFVYRSLSWHDFLKACAKACKTTGVVLLLIGISAAFGYFMALYEVPQKTGELMKAISTEPWVIFLMINVLLFVLGTFLDMAATILICTPIFLPIAHAVRHGPAAVRHRDADQLRARPEHAAGGHGAVRRLRDRRRLGRRRSCASISPFYGALVPALMLVTYVPAFSLWLPNLVLK